MALNRCRSCGVFQHTTPEYKAQLVAYIIMCFLTGFIWLALDMLFDFGPGRYREGMYTCGRCSRAQDER
jgi:hypothetical protein